MNSKLTTVAIVDDHTLFRDGLTNLLSEFEHISVLFTAKNGIDMQQQLCERDAPDIVLMDINMPMMDGHEATAWIKKHFPLTRILALSMYEDDINIIKMLRKGAGGYILKECTANELVTAIQSMIDTDYYINELVSGKLIRSIQDEIPDKTNGSTRPTFSKRELEFLKLCCSELTYKEIADIMHVSPRTVDGYRETFFEKLEIKSRIGLVLYSLRNKMVDL